MEKAKLQFVNENILKAFEKIGDSDLKKHLVRAFDDVVENPFCGIQIPKKLIPKEYVKKFGVKNVWKYNLPGAWRLIYSVESGTINLITIILEWMDHKSYERRFNFS
jgi:Txe/YoeB family toxin of Txe-Axe toxin-antitoxin module